MSVWGQRGGRRRLRASDALGARQDRVPDPRRERARRARRRRARRSATSTASSPAASGRSASCRWPQHLNLQAALPRLAGHRRLVVRGALPARRGGDRRPGCARWRWSPTAARRRPSASRSAPAAAALGDPPDQFEVPFGPTIVGSYALVAQRHMHEYGTTTEQLAEIAVTMRRHAALNPQAKYRDPITVEDVLASRVDLVAAAPARLLHHLATAAARSWSPRAERARDLAKPPVRHPRRRRGGAAPRHRPPRPARHRGARSRARWRSRGPASRTPTSTSA